MQELNSYEEFVENMTRTLIEQVLGLVKGYVESTMPVLNDNKLRVGPTSPKGFLLGDFESSYPVHSKS